MNFVTLRQEDNFEQMCEQDVFALGQQLAHVKTYSPSIVKTQRDQLITILMDLS